MESQQGRYKELKEKEKPIGSSKIIKNKIK